MNSKDQETHVLTSQLNEWNIEINALIEKQNTASITVKKLTQELCDLREKYRLATQQLRKQEASFYMWENIGDGG